VEDLDQIKNFIEKTIDAFGRIDILVNNAGIYKLLDLQGTSDEDWMETIAINLTGPFMMIRECLNYLKKNKQSKIINISSSAALNAFPNSTAYTASKGGLLAMSRQLAMELAPHQINVNVICPGVIQTPILGDLMSDPETKEALENCQPIGRIGTPEDIALCCVYLAADESNLVTGACIAVDGGWSTTIRGC